jgi:hypothetical protein
MPQERLLPFVRTTVRSAIACLGAAVADFAGLARLLVAPALGTIEKR